MRGATTMSKETKEIQGIAAPPKLSLKEKLKAVFKALSKMPYK